MSDFAAMLREISMTMEMSNAYSEFAERHNIRSSSRLTMADVETAVLIAERIAPRIEGKVVVEVGGGLGLLALAMGIRAREALTAHRSSGATGSLP